MLLCCLVKNRRVILFIAVIVITTASYFVWKKLKAPLPEAEEPAPVIAEQSAKTVKNPGDLAPAGLAQIWGSLREALAPKQEQGPDRDFLKEEAQAADAETLLKRLIELDPNKDKEAIAGILDEIRKIGYPAIKPLREMFKSYYPIERILLLLLAALNQIPDVEITDMIEPLIVSNPSKKVRDLARTIYKKRSTPEERQKLVKNIENTLGNNATPLAPSDKTYKIELLAAFGGLEALETLKEIVRTETNEGVREKAAIAIGEMKSEEGQAFLLDILKNDPKLRQAAVAALGKPPSDFITNSVIAIIEESEDAAIKLAGINILGQQGTSGAASYLLKLMQSSEKEEIYRAASNAVGKIALPETVQSLVDLLKTTEDRQRRRAIVSSLAQMGEKSIPYLSGVTLKYTGTVRSDAIRALAQMNKPEAYDVLKKMLEEWRVYDDPEAQRELLMGIKNYQNVEIVPSLERIVTQSPEESTRRTALEVAGDLKKKDELDFVMKVFQQDSSDTVKRGALRLMRRYGDNDTATILRLELLHGNNPQLKNDIEKTIEEIEKKKQ